MSGQLSDLHQSKKGVAVLAACIVQTLNESDTTFQTRFLDRLTRAYYELRDNPDAQNESQALELLAWTREYLTGFSRFSGQGEPLLGGE
jgi:hypothetical protein